MKKYFFSYSRSDQAFALRFAHDLKALGVDAWIDQLDIAVGQNWDRAIEAAIRSCEGFIVILSPRSVTSENVADEVSVACEGAKQIIPVLYEKCVVPMRLARLQYIDSTSDYQGALQRCASCILGTHLGARVPIPGQTVADAVPQAAGAQEGWRAQVLDEAEQKLVAFVGPVAGLLVRKVALGAHSEEEFYRQLAVAIPREEERLTFLKSVNAASAVQQPASSSASSSAPAILGTLSPDLIDKLCQVLTVYLGPIARHVLISEASEVNSRDDLYQRLGARVSSDSERAELLRKFRSL